MARSRRTIREFKLAKTLTPQHINGTVKRYRGHPFYPERIELIISGRKHTRVPSETRECAKENNVKIHRFWGFK